jgi:hypothetical protein
MFGRGGKTLCICMYIKKQFKLFLNDMQNLFKKMNNGIRQVKPQSLVGAVFARSAAMKQSPDAVHRLIRLLRSLWSLAKTCPSVSEILLRQSTCTCVCKAVFVYYSSRQGMEGVIVKGNTDEIKATFKPDADPPMILTGWIKEHP